MMQLPNSKSLLVTQLSTLSHACSCQSLAMFKQGLN